MFNYTSTTIINKNVDHVTGKELFVVGTGAEGNHIPTKHVQIKRLATFDPESVISITKAEPIKASVPEATITVPGADAVVKGTIFRLAIYVGLSGSQNSYYANDFVYKGKPFYIEAVAPSKSAADVAKALVENAKKYITMVYETELVKLSNSKGSAIINIKGIDGFLQFRQVELQKWVPATGEFASSTGEWEVVVPTENANVKAGEPGFGTYQHLLHNYVLPTGANLRYEHIIQDETPIVGEEYTQFILRMCKNRGIMGGAAVGQPVQSITTHCFWVASGVAKAFETALANLNKVESVDKTVAKKETVATHDTASKKVLDAKP